MEYRYTGKSFFKTGKAGERFIAFSLKDHSAGYCKSAKKEDGGKSAVLNMLGYLRVIIFRICLHHNSILRFRLLSSFR